MIGWGIVKKEIVYWKMRGLYEEGHIGRATWCSHRSRSLKHSSFPVPCRSRRLHSAPSGRCGGRCGGHCGGPLRLDSPTPPSAGGEAFKCSSCCRSKSILVI